MAEEQPSGVRSIVAQLNQQKVVIRPGASSTPADPSEDCVTARKNLKPMSPSGATQFALTIGKVTGTKLKEVSKRDSAKRTDPPIRPSVLPKPGLASKAGDESTNTSTTPTTAASANATRAPSTLSTTRFINGAPVTSPKPQMGSPLSSKPTISVPSGNKENLLRKRSSIRASSQVFLGSDGNRYRLREKLDVNGPPPARPRRPPHLKLPKIKLTFKNKSSRVSSLKFEEPLEDYDDIVAVKPNTKERQSLIPTMSEEEELDREDMEEELEIYDDVEAPPQENLEIYDDIAEPNIQRGSFQFGKAKSTPLNPSQPEEEVYEAINTP